MPVYAYAGRRPRVAPDAYVHPDAVLIGDVTIGSEASVWPSAVLRGDAGAIGVGDRTSVQDGTVVHTTAEWPTLIGAGCVVGHNAHLEGCTVEDSCLIGSMSVVLNRARVGTGSVVGAAALVPEDLAVPPGSMVLGVPGRVRPLTGEEHLEWIRYGVEHYVAEARRYPEVLRQVDLDDCRTALT
ncbi:gamma carbonic anhydrase family protein [Georgenia sp. AZ-5]|uniref:gamma carbonic anhydrase family protein n=1 Tax=Georgenia sp. AZ-5 TaxID=3367526 RepID=UPI0037551D03